LGRARNKRLNPLRGKDWLTPKQLNTRAAVTARMVLDSVLIISEELGKGPMLAGNEKHDTSMIVLAGWRFSKVEPNQKTQPDIIFHFIPDLGPKEGGITVTPFVAPWDFPNKDEIAVKIGQATARIQTQQQSLTQRVITDLKGGNQFYV